MIRSRVFLAISLFIAIAALLTYLFLDLREKEDRAYSYYQKGQYEKVLDLFSPNESIESELTLAILSQSISSLEKKANESKTKESTLFYLKEKHPDLKIEEWDTPLGIYLHINDIYFPLLKKHGIHYKKSLISKITNIQKTIPKEKVSHYLLQLILEDPRGLAESYSYALANLLRFPMEPIGEIESNFLLETLTFLSTSNVSTLYDNFQTVTGTNVNLRSGPGKENKEVGKVSKPDTTFCYEKDSHEETVSGKPGVFVQCYYPLLSKSAWIFSGFLEKTSPNQSLITSFESRFQSKESEERLDFVNWLGEKIPPDFYGTYISRTRMVESGEVGFPLYGNKAKDYRKICKKLSGKKNYFEFSYLADGSKESIPILEINLVYDGTSHVAYSIESESDSIIVNRNRYILEHANQKQNLSLSIESRAKDRLIANLKQRNIGLLQNIKSEPLDIGIYSSEKYFWEICLPLAKSPNREKVLLFDIKSGES